MSLFRTLVGILDWGYYTELQRIAEKEKKQRNTSAKVDEYESWKGSRWKYKKLVSGTVVVDRVLNGTVHWHFEQFPHAPIPEPMHKFLRGKERLE